jgi:hypothetical protein
LLRITAIYQHSKAESALFDIVMIDRFILKSAPPEWLFGNSGENWQDIMPPSP